MDEHSTQTATVGVDASPHAKEASPSLMSPDTTMLVLTWVTFFLLLAILQKFAWKPIVQALEAREERIRKSMDEADKIKSELADIQSSKDKILADAQRAGQDIIDEARKRAQDLAASIEAKAKNEAQLLVNAAHHEIQSEKERVKAALRRDSAEVAVLLAGKIMKENLDTDKNRKLVDQYIKEI